MQIVSNQTVSDSMHLSDNFDSMIKQLRRNRDNLNRSKVNQMAAKMLPQKMSHLQRVRLRSRSFGAN